MFILADTVNPLSTPPGAGVIFLKHFWGRGGGGGGSCLWERLGLFESGPYFINCETHYRYQRRGRNGQGYAYLLPSVDQVNDCLIWRLSGKVHENWPNTVTKTDPKPIDLAAFLYSSSVQDISQGPPKKNDRQLRFCFFCVFFCCCCCCFF